MSLVNYVLHNNVLFSDHIKHRFDFTQMGKGSFLSLIPLKLSTFFF